MSAVEETPAAPADGNTGLAEGFVQCSNPACREVQMNTRENCWKCGTVLKTEKASEVPNADYGVAEGFVKCPKPECGMIQPDDRRICWTCGTPLHGKLK